MTWFLSFVPVAIALEHLAPERHLLSYVPGPQPMDFAFNGRGVLTVFPVVLIAAQVAADGHSHWLKGVQLRAVCLILTLAFFFAPSSSA